MQLKSTLRKELLQKRKSITDKVLKDNAVFDNLVALQAFYDADTVLFYASLEDEISTDEAILFALEKGKRVALPLCIDKDGSMCFCYISSLDDLVCGSFNVREPDISKCERYYPCDNSDNVICIVPAIAYDKNGYRLGYGKGYYDRFLAANDVYSIGLCYSDLVVDNLPINEYDIAVDLIVTEKGYKNQSGGNYG